MIDDAIAESAMVEKLTEVHKNAEAGPSGAKESVAEVGEAAVETVDGQVNRLVDEPVAVFTNDTRQVHLALLTC